MAANNAYESKFTGRQIEDVIEFFHTKENYDLLKFTLPDVSTQINSINTDIQNLKNLVGGAEVIGKFSNYLSLNGGTLNPSAVIISNKNGASFTSAKENALLQLTSVEGTYRPIFSLATQKSDQGMITGSFSCGVTKDNTLSFRYLNNNTSTEIFYGTADGVLMGAAWNDYAEFRNSNEQCPGRVVCECGDGHMERSTERLQPGAEIVSDTFGFAIGKSENCQTPIAVSGRVLAYPNENKTQYSAGDAVCSGPNGTVSKMTREEIIQYPERIIGTVSEIPTYEFWGKNNIPVNDRIWIRIK